MVTRRHKDQKDVASLPASPIRFTQPSTPSGDCKLSSRTDGCLVGCVQLNSTAVKLVLSSLTTISCNLTAYLSV